VQLIEKKSKFIAKGIYLLNQKGCSDYNFNIQHLASNTKSHLNFRSIISEYAKSIFNANSYIAKNIKSIETSQKNYNIQLNNTSEVYINPNLEIYSEDVICSHGATVGNINQEELFYFQSRGITYKNAMFIILKNFVEKILLEINRPKQLMDEYYKIFKKKLLNIAQDKS